MIGIDPEDEITGSEEIINYDDIKARLPLLRPWHVEDPAVDERGIADPTVAAFTDYLPAATFAALANARAHLTAQARMEATGHLTMYANLIVVEYSWESDELRALRELEAEMRYLNEASGRASAINDSYMDEFIRDELESAYGSDAVEGLDGYLKWDDIRAAKEMDMSRTTYRGYTFYLTP